MIKSYTIDVSKNIITNSKPNSAGSCMVAVAVKEQVPGAYSVKVTMESVRFNVGDTRYMYPLPARAGWCVHDFDVAFDVGGKEEVVRVIKPMKFTLDGRQATSAKIVRIGEVGLKRPRKKGYKQAATIRKCPDRRHAGGFAYTQAGGKPRVR